MQTIFSQLPETIKAPLQRLIYIKNQSHQSYFGNKFSLGCELWFCAPSWGASKIFRPKNRVFAVKFAQTWCGFKKFANTNFRETRFQLIEIKQKKIKSLCNRVIFTFYLFIYFIFLVYLNTLEITTLIHSQPAITCLKLRQQCFYC